MVKLLNPEPSDMYFVGRHHRPVFHQRIFPIWAKALGIDACIQGHRYCLHARQRTTVRRFPSSKTTRSPWERS